MDIREDSAESLLEFPCEFPIKVISKVNSDLADTVYKIIKHYAPEINKDQLSCKSSAQGNYQSITVRLMAVSQAQLDAIYIRLCEHEEIMLAL